MKNHGDVILARKISFSSLGAYFVLDFVIVKGLVNLKLF